MNDTQSITTRDCFFTAELELAERSSESAKTAPFRLVARSGQPINHHIWGPIVHDNNGVQHKQRIPIDFNHDVSDIVGFGNHFNVLENGDLEIRGALTPYGDNDRATEILTKSELGVPWEASINFAGDMVVETIAEGETVEANGHEFSGPLTVIREWQLRGVAITPYGYDASTSVELSQHSHELKVIEMTKQEFNEAVEPEAVEAKEAVDAAAVDDSSEAVVETATAVEEQEPEAVELAAQPYFDVFGEATGALYFAKGISIADAMGEEIIRLRHENKELHRKVDIQATAGADDALSFSVGDPNEPEPGKDADGNLTGIPVSIA